jgi:hypothetical protein
LVVHEVYPRTNGTLGVKIPAGVANAFQKKEHLTSSIVTLSAADA